MIYNRIPITLGEVHKFTGPPVNWRYDVTQILEFSCMELPPAFVVDFCNEGDTTTKPMVGTATGGVQIPDEFLATGKRVKAYLVFTGVDEGASETDMKLRFL